MAEQKYYGIYQGVVTNIKDPENRGRIKIKCPDVLGPDVVSAWCDPCVNVAYDTGGDFCIPSNDETVWVMFIGGDANKPVWLGGWWQKNMTPLATKYTNVDKVRIISYADCTITLKEGTITINVGEGVGDLIIEDDEVKVRGNLTVTGSITASSVSAGSVTATPDKDGGSGVVQGVTVKTQSGINLATHKHSGVTTGSSKTGSATS